MLAATCLLVACSEGGDAPAQTSPEILSASAEPVPLASPQPPRGPFAPRDDCAADPKAAAFTVELKQVVVARDLDRLIAMTAPDVALGFGGEGGAENMRRSFGTADGGMWEELAEVIAMGCAIDQAGNVVMPWYVAQDIPGDFFEYLLVTGDDVAIREARRAGSTRMATVSWDVVDLPSDSDASATHIFGGPAGDGWVKVRTRGEQPVSGFIHERFLRSVVDYRIIADKTSGSYRISAFLAGD